MASASKFTPANPVLLNCEVCGCEIREFPSHAARRRACSTKCYAALRNRKPLTERFWHKVNKNGPVPTHCPELGPCWEWTGKLIKKGYGRIQEEFQGKVILAHRASWAIHYGKPSDDMQVCHKCDNPACIRPDHLFTGTNSDNVADMHSKKRHAHGEKAPWSKLTASEVLEIRTLKKVGITQRVLAEQFGVSPGNIGHICQRDTWQHI